MEISENYMPVGLMGGGVDRGIGDVEGFMGKLQENLMQKMEFNWRIIHAIGETITERDFLYNM
jgi:hypothetical protein